MADLWRSSTNRNLRWTQARIEAAFSGRFQAMIVGGACYQPVSLTTEMSGASSFFMPWTW